MKKIDKIFDDLHYELITEKQAKQQVLDLFSISGCYSITFGRDLKCKVKVTNGAPEVEAAMNGWGDNISLSDISVDKLQLPLTRE